MGKRAFRWRLPLGGVLTACALGAAPHAGVAQTSDLAKPRSSVEIVLESSEGMGVEGVGGARKAIVGAVRTPPEGTPVGLRVFGAKVPAKEGSAACSDSQLVVPVGPVDAQATSAALKHLKPTAARSPVSLALTRAAKDLPPTGNRTIVLVGSDADDCAPAPPTCQVTPGARQPIRVDAIGLEIDPAGRRDLQCTAQRTGGVYSDAHNNRALEPELEAALGRATRDRRSLGTPLVGALAEQQGTTAKAGQYIDSIAPDTERWYHVAAPLGQRLTAVATLLAPPGTDVSGPGSSLNLEGFGAGPRAGKLAGKDATATASNLFAFDPSQAITVSVAAVPSRAGNDLRVALHDSPDKQLAQSLRGRSFVLELLFDLAPEAAPARPHTAVAPAKSSHDVSWPAAGAAAVVCALIAFAALAFVPRRVRSGDEA